MIKDKNPDYGILNDWIMQFWFNEILENSNSLKVIDQTIHYKNYFFFKTALKSEVKMAYL